MIGSAYGSRKDRKITYHGDITLRAGSNKIALLSVAMGLPVSGSLMTLICFIKLIIFGWSFGAELFWPFVWCQNIGVHYELWSTGVVGPVVIRGMNDDRRDLTWQTWSYQVRLFFKFISFIVRSTPVELQKLLTTGILLFW